MFKKWANLAEKLKIFKNFQKSCENAWQKAGGGIIDGDILVVSKKFFEDFAMQNQIKIQVVSYPHFAKKLKLSLCLKNFCKPVPFLFVA